MLLVWLPQFQLGDVVPVDSEVQRSPPMSQWPVQQRSVCVHAVQNSLSKNVKNVKNGLSRRLIIAFVPVIL